MATTGTDSRHIAAAVDTALQRHGTRREALVQLLREVQAAPAGCRARRWRRSARRSG